MLTAKAGEDERVAGLLSGADDYLVKPFSPRELVARVRAVLRRTQGGEVPLVPVLSFDEGRLEIDTEHYVVRRDGVAVDLTPNEYRLLTSLATYPGRAYSRLELVDRVQGYDFDGYERTIDVHVKNLRKKIEPDPARAALRRDRDRRGVPARPSCERSRRPTWACGHVSSSPSSASPCRRRTSPPSTPTSA